MNRFMKKISAHYMDGDIVVKSSSRLHRLVARLSDTHYDDLTDDRIEEIEIIVDSFRNTHANGDRLPSVREMQAEFHEVQDKSFRKLNAALERKGRK